MRFLQQLKNHYLASLEQSFKQFRWGAVLFFIGLVIIYAAAKLLTPSLTQEWITLVGLIVLGVGFVTAMLAQFRMLMGRLLRFIQKQ